MCSDSPTGCNLDGTGKILKWIAVKFNGQNDWMLLLGYPEQSDEYIFRAGAKTRDKGNITCLVPCTDEVFELYNM
jgi:hypothetical protein